MSSNRLRVGLIGLGAIGYRVAQGLAQHPEAAVTYIVDRNEELAARVAGEFGNIPWSAGYKEMLAGDQVDVVYVGVPPRFHHQIALDVIAAGKQIFCEKPLALTLDEAREMTESAIAAGVANALNVAIHLSAGVRLFGEQLQAGYIGQLRRAEINMLFPKWPRGWQQNPWIGGREQGGPIREVTPHLFQIVLREIGPVTRVLAHMQYPEGDDFTCEQAAFGALELVSGQIVTVNALCNLPRKESVTLTAYGTEGTLGLVEWQKPVGARGDGPLEPLALPEQAPPKFYDLLVRHLRGEQGTGIAGFEDGYRLQQVLDAWERSAASGQWEEIRA